jgi:large subunit ribosomal protein L2
MPIKIYNPTSPGRRFGTVLDFSEITTKKRPEPSLIIGKRGTGGRNNHGHLTRRHRAGGHKRLLRKVDFLREKDGVPAKVDSIQYDPNRSANIALLHYADGEKRYILAPMGLVPGMTVRSGTGSDPLVGNSMTLSEIPVGLEIHNVEMHPGRGGQLCRSAGSVAQLTSREGDYAVVQLSSGELRKIHITCRATIGRIGNTDHQNVSLGKAGRKRHMGHRPQVRGTAMNPVDHPMGGGEGRTAGGRHPCSPSAVLAKGGKTRRKNHPTNKFIMRRRKPGPHQT